MVHLAYELILGCDSPLRVVVVPYVLVQMSSGVVTQFLDDALLALLISV